jgi:hypothetical protein
MADLQRPTRVVVVDADNPMNEVRGEFFWREDHEALLAAARQSAYRAGYEAGIAANPSLLAFSIRRRSRPRVLRWAVATFVAVAFLVSVIGSILR